MNNTELTCPNCFSLGQQLELAQQEILRLREDIKHMERDHREDMRAAYAEGAWNGSGSEGM